MSQPLYRGQGNRPFNTALPVSAASRGQEVPYGVNAAPPVSTAGQNLNLSIIDLPPSDISEPLFRFRLRRDYTFPSGTADAAIAASGSPVFSIKKNGAQVGTATFSGATGTVAMSDSSFPSGCLFELYPPSPADPTLDRVSITLEAA